MDNIFFITLQTKLITVRALYEQLKLFLGSLLGKTCAFLPL